MGLQSEIDIAIQTVEAIVAISLGDEGADAEVLRVFEKDHGSGESIPSFVGNDSADRPRSDL
jgi:hypothetical protein